MSPKDRIIAGKDAVGDFCDLSYGSPRHVLRSPGKGDLAAHGLAGDLGVFRAHRLRAGSASMAEGMNKGEAVQLSTVRPRYWAENLREAQ